jgi:hypothetical protein
MSAATTTERPVQLTIQLVGHPQRGYRRRGVPRPFWTDADLIDAGGPTLRASARTVRVRLDAAQTDDGGWAAHHDAVFSRSGTSGATKRQLTRRDALASAAHGLARHCGWILRTPNNQPREDVRSAREVLRWLEILDLL